MEANILSLALWTNEASMLQVLEVQQTPCLGSRCFDCNLVHSLNQRVMTQIHVHEQMSRRGAIKGDVNQQEVISRMSANIRASMQGGAKIGQKEPKWFCSENGMLVVYEILSEIVIEFHHKRSSSSMSASSQSS